MNGKSSAIPGLDRVVIEALELLDGRELPQLELGECTRRLVVASGNALPTGRILLADEDAVFAGEDQYAEVLGRIDVDGALVISASGEKHAPIIVDDLIGRGIETRLITCNGKSSAARLLPADRVFETPSRPEPITYNTSTYLGMILASTGERPAAIREHIEREVEPLIPDLTAFDAFYLIVESRFDGLREMFVTKFDELFGPRVPGRCYTVEQTLHAKTVIRSDKELFVSFGYVNELFGEEGCRLNIPLPRDAGPAAAISVGYYTIGRIQGQFPPWFAESAEEYKELQPRLFERVLGH